MSARLDIVSKLNLVQIFKNIVINVMDNWTESFCKLSFLLVRGVNTARGIVQYCQSQPMFREVNNKRYLSATTTRRLYFHVSRDEVESPDNVKLFKQRRVCTLQGEHILFYFEGFYYVFSMAQVHNKLHNFCKTSVHLPGIF